MAARARGGVRGALGGVLLGAAAAPGRGWSRGPAAARAAGEEDDDSLLGLGELGDIMEAASGDSTSLPDWLPDSPETRQVFKLLQGEDMSLPQPLHWYNVSPYFSTRTFFVRLMSSPWSSLKTCRVSGESGSQSGRLVESPEAASMMSPSSPRPRRLSSSSSPAARAAAGPRDHPRPGAAAAPRRPPPSAPRTPPRARAAM